MAALVLLAAPFFSAAAGRAVTLVAESETRLELSWRPSESPVPSVSRIAVPPGTRAVLESVTAAASGAPVRAGEAVRVVDGYFGRLPFAEVALDPVRLPPGLMARGLVLTLRLEPRGDEATPPAFRAAGLAPAASGDDATSAGTPAVPSSDVVLADEAAVLRGLGLLNPASARRFLAESRDAPWTWPGRGAAPTHGLLERRVPRGQSLGGTSSLPASSRATAHSDLALGRVQLLVDRDGVYRVTHGLLAASGIDLAGARTAELRVTSRGAAAAAREIAVRVADPDGDGFFGPGDWLELWGEALVADARPGYFQQADFTDVNAYFVDAAPGPRLRWAVRDATPNPATPQVTAFLDTARLERDAFFLANHRTGRLDVDHFYSCPSLLTGGPAASRVESVPLPGLDVASALRAALRVQLLGRTSFDAVAPDHLTEVLVNGTPLSSVTADGYAVIEHDVANLDAGLLADPAEVTVRLPGVPGTDPERCELNWIEIDYPRSFAAVGGRLVADVDPPARVTVTGLAGADLTVLDVTDPVNPVLLTGVQRAGDAASFEVAGPSTRRIAVAAHPAGEPAFVPRAISWLPASGLRDPSLAVDLLVVGPASWVAPPLPSVQRYVDFRESEGLRVRLVSVEELTSEFNDGLVSPFALSRLLSWAMGNWAVAPRWCLLLGDANVDYKDALGGRVVLPSDCTDSPDPCGFDERAWAQHVPTYVVDNPADQALLGYYASDSLLAMVAGGDWLPDVALGRLPARSGAEVEALLDKVVAYGQLGAAPPWAYRLLTVADEVTSGQEAIEESGDDAVAAHVSGCYQRSTLYYQRDYGATNAATFTDDLLAQWRDPATSSAVITYVGHGNTFTWGNDTLLTNAGLSGCRDDLASLVGPGAPEPVVLNADCVAGGFMHVAGPSLLEDLVRRPEGGAIAAFGPTGITDLGYARPILDRFLAGVYGHDGRGLRLGDVVLGVQASLAAFASSGWPEELESNVLLGDPSLRLAIPFAPPAGELRAVAGDGRVTLDWDAVPGADAYTIHRSGDGPDGPYVAVATGLAGTTHVDEGLENARLYTYAVEPTAGCTLGRWSERVSARPCNQVPPQPPASLQVASTSCAGQFVLTWTASPSPSLEGHVLRVHAGRDASGPIEDVRVVSGTFAALSGLVPFRWYTFELTARDLCGVESVVPLLATARATCAIETNEPAFVTDLRVRRSGSDLLLGWSPVTETIQGDPLAPSEYVVHAASRADFLADGGTLVDRGPTTSATVRRRVGNGVALEFFAVAARDGAGLTGGVGHDFPQGVTGLLREDVDAATYRLSWDPVVHDIRGETTSVARYHVHASASGPLTRQDVEGLTPAATVTDPSALVSRSLGDFHFVVAEDVHGNRSAY